MNNKPEGEDWVTLRYECSALSMFVKLRHGAEEDVKTRMKLLDPNQHITFRVDKDETFFNVMREGREVPKTWVQFNLSNESITIENTKGVVVLRAALTLTDDAECRLKLETGEELAPWQFRKRALEDLFFHF